MGRTIAIVMSLCMLLPNVFLPPALAQSLQHRLEVTPYFDLKGYSWKEFSETGSEDLKESGMLLSLGAIPRFAFTKDLRFFAQGDFQFYFGNVNYDGYVQDNVGNRTPFTTEVGYFGFEIAVSSGYSFPISKGFELAPRGGFGIEYWNRDIGRGQVKAGYVEKYWVVLGDLAVEGRYTLNRDIRLSSTISMRIPVSISESVDLSTASPTLPSDISLSPGKNPRFVFKLGGTFYNTFAELYFITWTLSRSAEDRGFLQPESTRQNYGMRVGYTFGIF
jgi:hypothetical protein